MVARHSILYTQLPDRFIAFDLYDRVEDSFVSRSVSSGILADKGIHQVPMLVSGQTLTRTDFLRMLDQQSAFSNEKLEGVCVRFEDVDRKLIIDRGKIVRGDFIAGNSHWSKNQILLNGIRR
jgi:atypical dual specificity phosphatase